MWRRSCGRSGPASSRSPGNVGRSPRISRDAVNRWLATRSSAATPVSPQPRRAGVAAKGKRCRRGGMASAGLNVARQLGHGSWPTLETYGQVDGRVQRGAKARRGGRHHAGAQRPASRASGLDRIVGVVSAIGRYDTFPAIRDRGATTGPPGCAVQSPPVPFRWRRRGGFQGLFASWAGWRRQKSFPSGRGPRFESWIAHPPDSRNSLHLNDGLVSRC